MTPEQHLGELVQQGRGMNDGGVGIGAVDRERQREIGAAMRAQQHALQA